MAEATALASSDVYFLRGEAKRENSDLDGAIADFTKTIEIDPQAAWAYCNRGLAKRDKGDLDGAIGDWDKTIEIDPQGALGYIFRGDAKRKKGEFDSAVADYSKAIEIDPRVAYPYEGRGRAKHDKGDLDGATADYDKAIEIEPRLAEAYLNRGRTKIDSGDYESAIADFSKAVEINPRLIGADPFDLIDDIILRGWDVYRTTKPKFEEWAKEVRKEFGKEAEPHLKNIYTLIDVAVRDSENDDPSNQTRHDPPSTSRSREPKRSSSHPRVQRAFRNLLNYRKNHPEQFPEGKLYGEMEQGEVRASLPESDDELAKSDVDTLPGTELKSRYSDG